MISHIKLIVISTLVLSFFLFLNLDFKESNLLSSFLPNQTP
jgi:hypothetical protein